MGKQEEVAVKKKSVGPRKQLPAKEEEPAFGGFKLKKAETVKRGWDDGGLEGVNLKHHEFEKEPEVETPERNTDVLLGDGVPEKDDGKGKKKKKVPKKTSQKQVIDDEDEDLDQDRQAEAITEMDEEALVGIEELSSDSETTITQQGMQRQQHMSQRKTSSTMASI